MGLSFGLYSTRPEESTGLLISRTCSPATFSNICGLTFGKDPETLTPEMPENPFAVAFDTATEATLQRLIYRGFLWRLKKVLGGGSERMLTESLKAVEDYMNEAIDARKENPSDDLLSLFQEKSGSDGNLFDQITVLQQIALNFILAGRDTSSITLSWFFWLVLSHAHAEGNFLHELKTILRESRSRDPRKWVEEPLTFDEADKLIYLKAALAETLRLYPSVPEDFKYAVSNEVLPEGTFVPAGSTISYSIYSMGRMEEIGGRTAWGSSNRGGCPQRETGSIHPRTDSSS